MVAYTTLGQDPIPSDSDSVVIPQHMAAYADAISKKLFHLATDVADRDVLYADAPAGIVVGSTVSSAMWLKTVEGGAGADSWLTLFADTGNIFNTGWSAASGWEIVNTSHRRILDSIVLVDAMIQRSGAALTASAAGNFTDTLMCTIPSGFRPHRDNMVMAAKFSFGGVDVQVNQNGQVYLISGHSNSVVDTDHNIYIHGVYSKGAS